MRPANRISTKLIYCMPQPFITRVVNVKSTLPEIKSEIPDFIISLICQELMVTLNEMMGPSRERRITEPRFIAFTLLYSYAKITKCEIGRIFNRDHSTVIHGIKQTMHLRQFDRDFKKKYSTVHDLILREVSKCA